jgi:MFS family permease
VTELGRRAMSLGRLRTVDRPEGRALGRPAAFRLLAAVFLLAFFASTAASPLYEDYQRQFCFSAITLTAVLAVYVVALLGTLLACGRLSDHLGRRPVIVAGLIISAGACGSGSSPCCSLRTACSSQTASSPASLQR